MAMALKAKAKTMGMGLTKQQLKIKLTTVTIKAKSSQFFSSGDKPFSCLIILKIFVGIGSGITAPGGKAQ
jgi:hypothetical protein